MVPAGNTVVTLYHKLSTQSSAPEDGRNHCPKHVELIGIINKTLIVASGWLSISFVSMMHGQTNIKLTAVFLEVCPSVMR
jgi:hypothetical protein